MDDECDITELFRDALQSLPGLSIFTFTDPTIALEHFKINKRFYALVISDLRMPVMDGIQLITRVKDMNHSVRTILMTAFDVDDKLFREYSKKEIINGFAQKPVSLQTLVHEVSDQLHSYEMHKILLTSD
ncbi:MAG: response regulator [Nitrososphaeraceae archaeon]|nr:response regulator [Nitrososphaeraceae archaeon]